MPTTAVTLKPGVTTVRTPSLNEAGIASSDMIRFREGLIEKRGGWVRYFATAVSGIPRAIWPFLDFLKNVYVGIGTTTNLYVIKNGSTLIDVSPRALTTTTGVTVSSSGTVTSQPTSLMIIVTDPNYVPQKYEKVRVNGIFAVSGASICGDITCTAPNNTAVTQAGILPPYSYFALFTTKLLWTTTVPSSTVTAPTYSTQLGSNVVNVNLVGHGFTSTNASGQTFVIYNPITVGGITLTGTQTITDYVDANNFTITQPTAATMADSATPSGGIVQLTSYPSNPAGTSLLGTQITSPSWTVASYGNMLISCAYQGPIYQWSPSLGSQSSTVVANSPQATGILVSDASQQIIAYGGNPAANFDPNYVAWSDTGNPKVWTAAIGNQAGSYRIPTGSAIIGAAPSISNVILLWTDIDVWAMQYVGYPLVYSFTKLSSGCGLLSQFAWVRLGPSIYWMSQKRFWMYDGNSVQPLDCPLYDNVFAVLSAANVSKIRGAANASFNEAVWFFPSASGTGENDMYICFNPVENAWDYGSMARSSWVDQSIAGLPMATTSSGLVYQHETSPDGDGSAIVSKFTTGLFQLEEGENFVFADWIRPDFKFILPSTLGVTVNTYNYVGDTPVVAGPFTFTVATQYINMRCRGRYVSLTFSGSDVGSFWRIGRTQVRYSTSGRR